MPTINPLLPADHDRWFDTRPSSWQAVYAAYDRLAVSMTALTPQLGIRGLTILGRLANRCALHGPSPGELAALYGSMPAPVLARIARDVAALRFKNRAAIAIFYHAGVDPLARLVRHPDLAELERMYTDRRPR